jgi:hypothetical protein
MFGLRNHVHPLHGLQGLQHVVGIARDLHLNKDWKRVGFQPRPGSGPSLPRLLLAGLAVVAFVKLMSAANASSRSRARTITLGILLLAVGAVVMSFRRSARRHRW